MSNLDTRTNRERWELARAAYLGLLGRAVIAAWVPFAVIILAENQWAPLAFLGVCGGTGIVAVAILGVLFLRADLQVISVTAPPPAWTADRTEGL